MTPEAQKAFDNLRRDNESQERLRVASIQKRDIEEAERNERLMNRPDLRTDIQVGTIAEDCALHIGEVVHCDPYRGDVRIRSMFDGVERSCDLYHCGVIAQTAEDIELKKRLYAEGGMNAVARLYFSAMPNHMRPEEFQDK